MESATGSGQEACDVRQVGGHGGEMSMRFRGADLLKPATAPREVAWYESLGKGELPRVVAERGLCPAYRGTEDVTLLSGKVVPFLVLENVLHDFQQPSILDMKMGTQTWDDDCSPKKLAGHKEIDARTTTATHGFRIGGMMVHDVARGVPVRRKKYYGLELAPEAVLEEFLWDGRAFRADVVETFLKRLSDVREFFAGGTHRCFAVSVMLAYDAAAEGKAGLRMIDFAHTWRCAECPYDDGVLFGIDSLSDCLRRVAGKFGM